MFSLYGFSFTFFEFVLLVFISVWGLRSGIINWFVRLYSLFTTRRYVQTELGKMLDYIWVVSIIVFCGSYLLMVVLRFPSFWSRYEFTSRSI